MPTGSELIAAERARQVSEEGWTPEHDEQHTEGELVLAAVCYATPIQLYRQGPNRPNRVILSDPWPEWWDPQWDKRPHTPSGYLRDNCLLSDKLRIRQLAKAGALIAAEIDRIQRASGRAGK